jgi:hypothetical protein
LFGGVPLISLLVPLVAEKYLHFVRDAHVSGDLITVDSSVLRGPQSEMMRICNTNNELSLSEFNSQCCRSAPVGSRDKGAAVFWLLLLLFGVTLGIALAGQRLLERHSSRGVKK